MNVDWVGRVNISDPSPIQQGAVMALCCNSPRGSSDAEEEKKKTTTTTKKKT